MTDEQLSKALAELARVEQAMGDAEKDVEIYRIKKTQGLYDARRAITSTIPNFWYIVLAENDDFAEYVRPEDLKYLEHISDIHVHHDVADHGDATRYRDFSINVTFGTIPSSDSGSDSSPVPAQTVTKKFSVELVDGEDVLTSEPVDVAWPAELRDICPAIIRANKQGQYTLDEKKRYRQGMASLFAWFEWTGRRQAKEFKAGDDLARLIAEDLHPNAVRYYVAAVNSDTASDESSEGDELDVSDEDEQPAKRAREE